MIIDNILALETERDAYKLQAESIQKQFEESHNEVLRLKLELESVYNNLYNLQFNLSQIEDAVKEARECL